MKIYDIAVIGAGAAGMMAAIRAAELHKAVVLIERNDSPGRKILITGKGRCNITNSADMDTFIDKFGKRGEFYRTAFYKFFNDDVVDFFRAHGLETKVERQGRIFPVDDKAQSVVGAMKKAMELNGVDAAYSSRVSGFSISGNKFEITLDTGAVIVSKKMIIATGGASYKATGSSGDGFIFAEKAGHKIAPLKPALVPLVTGEAWVKELQGLALENIRITFEQGKRRIISGVGELMFTHFGVSGPLVLDHSGVVVDMLKDGKEVRLYIDFKPGLRDEQIDSKLVHKLTVKGSAVIKNLMKDILPQKMIERFLKTLMIRGELKANQVTQAQRRSIVAALKAFPLTVKGSLPIEEAMVTGGGVSVKEINPRTMESKVIPGLYFAGEVIEGEAASGGYNLQQAFSTGYLAGESASYA